MVKGDGIMEKSPINCCVCGGSMTVEKKSKEEENGNIISQTIYTCQKCSHVQISNTSTTGFVDPSTVRF